MRRLSKFFLLVILLHSVDAWSQSSYSWSGSTFNASGTQAKRYTIGRVYYNPIHWISGGNIKLTLRANYWSAGNMEYLVQNAQSGAQIYCTSGYGYLTNYVRVLLSDPIDANSSYGGVNNVYREIYLDADNYTQWYVNAEVAGGYFAFDKTSINSTEYSYVTLFTSPASQNISGFGEERKTIQYGGAYTNAYFPNHVSIGNNNPEYALDVSSTIAGKSRVYIHPADLTQYALLQFTNNGGTSYLGMDNSAGTGLGSGIPYAMTMYGGGVPIVMSTSGLERMRITTGGNIAIGTWNAPEKLSVNGTVLATKVRVLPYANWADYVFHPSYKLRSLDEVEKYIAANKHLPDVISAKEVASKGVDLVDVQAQLLRKIEELTLYVIELKKEMNVLKREIPKKKILNSNK